MSVRPLFAALCLIMTMPALAVDPDIRPGQWEYTNVTRFEGMPMPDQTHTHTECVTPSDIEKGAGFLEDAENCDVTSMDMRRSGMTYTMVCREQGAEIRMDGDIRFMGDRADGKLNAQMDSPMGPMKMKIELAGRRIGDC